MPYPLTVIPNKVADNKSVRQCGDCVACCVTFPMMFEPLNKPAFTPCQHLCHYGCGTWLTRPKPCREFECLFLNGHLVGDERQRPDNLGIIFYNTVSPLSEVVGPHVAAIEVHEGAAAKTNVRYLLNKLSRKMFVLVHHYQYKGYELLGPAGMVHVAKLKMEQLAMAQALAQAAAPPPSPIEVVTTKLASSLLAS